MTFLDGAAPPDADIVKDGSDQGFMADVIEASRTAPVIVDFWAPWCGPCRQLGPPLEKAVRGAGGKVRLVKINIDEHPGVAGQLGVKSIPAVYAFDKGRPIDGFMGALPESQIKSFIERLVGPVDDGVEEIMKLAEATLLEGKAELAASTFQQALELDPESEAALGGLVRSQVSLNNLDLARQILLTVEDKIEKSQPLAAARAALEVATQASSVGELSALQEKVSANPGDHASRLELAIALNASSDREGATDALIEIIRRDRSWNEDAARKQLIQFFEAWGAMDPETVAARRKLSAVLFS